MRMAARLTVSQIHCKGLWQAVPRGLFSSLRDVLSKDTAAAADRNIVGPSSKILPVLRFAAFGLRDRGAALNIIHALDPRPDAVRARHITVAGGRGAAGWAT